MGEIEALEQDKVMTKNKNDYQEKCFVEQQPKLHSKNQKQGQKPKVTDNLSTVQNASLNTFRTSGAHKGSEFR